jgi:flagellar secretion chaperone FliS
MRYQEQALAGATGVDLIVSLYDGWLRFLYRAAQAVEEDDVIGRRYAIKRALGILMYLQARLRMDCGSPALALNDFYAAMFTMTLEASRANSVVQLQEVIACVRNVREAWVVVARDPEANRMLPRDLRMAGERSQRTLPAATHARQTEMQATQSLRLSA